MTIDLNTARMCKSELVKCRREMEEVYNELRSVHIELLSDDENVFEELAYELYRKMSYTEQQIYNLRSMIRALESIISIYERTERRNINKAEGLDIVTSGVTSFVPVGNYVPSEIVDLFR